MLGLEGTCVNVTGLTFSSISGNNVFDIYGSAVLTLNDVRVEDVSANFVSGTGARCVIRNSVFQRLVGHGVSMIGGIVEIQGVIVTDCPALNLRFLICIEGCVPICRLWFTHYRISQIHLHG